MDVNQIHDIVGNKLFKDTFLWKVIEALALTSTNIWIEMMSIPCILPTDHCKLVKFLAGCGQTLGCENQKLKGSYCCK